MRSLAANVTNLCNRLRTELLLDGQVPKLGVGGGLLARRPRLKRNVGIDGDGSGDGRRVGADHARQGTIPLCTCGERRCGEQIWSRLTVAGATMPDKTRVHDSVAGTHHKPASRVPRQSNPRLELQLGWIQRSVWGSVHPKRSEEHTSELQSRGHLVCRLLLEKKKARHSTEACLPLT